jgi:radical SAM/Cys-rich protein
MLRGRCARRALLLCRPQPLLGRGFSTQPAERIVLEPIVPVSGSLIPETLSEMDTVGSEFMVNADELRKVGKARLSLQERKRRRRALDALGVPEFTEFLEQEVGLPKQAGLPKQEVTILQLNVGLHCNQACTHCHVESSPRRKEAMDEETVEQVLRVLEASPHVKTVDITGGAPEMSPAFWPLVRGARALGREVIDRCNLTVLFEPGMEALPQFLADEQVRVVASLPCYSQKNVDTQRGNKVFERSIAGLRLLNAAGFGRPGSPLKLDLVYNPGGAFLPPSQDVLLGQYTKELHDNFGISFNELFTITNMPIKRFADHLYKSGELEKYMQLLVDNFNPATIPETMCRSLVSVSWDGKLYDCDFNMALEIESPHRSIFDIDSLSTMADTPIGLGNHCFACTAGAGSS